MAWTDPITRATDFLVLAATWNNEHVENLKHLKEVKYQVFTTDKTITATTVATADEIVNAGVFTYEAVPHFLEFYCPSYAAPAAATNVIVRDGTTVLGTIARVGVSAPNMALHLVWRFTPTAASHVYNVAAWLGGAGSGTMNGGTGGAAGDGTTDLGGYIYIHRAIV